MFKNYVTVAWRNLLRHKTYFFLNISGLAIGLGCFLLISLYVLDELSFDRFNAKADRTYRINADIRFGGGDMHAALSADIMGPMLKKDYPEVEQFTRIYNNNGSKLIRKGNAFITEPNVAHVDSTFFDVFTFPALAGNTSTALDAPNTVVITESTAIKYFGTIDALGKTIETNDRGSTLYHVTAVIKDMPENGHFHYDFLFSMKNADYPWGQAVSHNFHTYLVLRQGTDYKTFQPKLYDYTNRYVLPVIQQIMQIKTMEEFKKSGNMLEYSLIPLTRIHLYSKQTYELAPGGNIQYVYIFSAVALFILLIACINFMNLSTARSANRAREVGIRKVLGSGRRELIQQFLSESTLMVWMAMILAIGIAWAALPLFNNVAAKNMHITSLFSPLVLPVLIALPFLVGLMAGSYPAFFLSSFMPIAVLKGKLKLGSSSGGIRSVLVIFQFGTSILLMISTIVIYRQLHFIQTKDLGFNRDQVLIINDASSLKDGETAFKDEVLQLNGVLSGTMTGFLPVDQSNRSDDVYFKNAVADVKNGLDMQNWSVDYDYFKTMGMTIIKGRGFSRDYPSDADALIINETTAKIIGYKDPVGQKLYSLDDSNRTTPHTIIGEVKNFNFESLREDIAPLCFRFSKNNTSLISFKVHTTHIAPLLDQVETRWKTLAPGMPFSYRFMDDSFDEMYRTEQRVGKIALTFSALAILIACLGLFGLATFIAEQRTREIGIRKVLGASVQGIVRLMSKDFVRLVGISFVIAAPIGWYCMHRWLQDFVYRVGISWWIFALAGISALAIALFTVSFQSIKAALANPVKSLRSE
jgi:putative ABC transport system permease protein